MGRFLNADVLISTEPGLLGNNQFAYCCSNPVNRADPTGLLWQELWELFKESFIQSTKASSSVYAVAGVISQGDTMLPGLADMAALGVAGIALLTSVSTAVTEVITTYTISKNSSKDKGKTEAIAIAQSGTNYQYWEASRVKNQVLPGRGLSFTEASVHVASGRDIMCANQGAALWLIIVNGYWTAVGPEIHGDEGYYWHYHPNRNSHTHIWFY